jgi:hypothetical protein
MVVSLLADDDVISATPVDSVSLIIPDELVVLVGAHARTLVAAGLGYGQRDAAEQYRAQHDGRQDEHRPQSHEETSFSGASPLLRLPPHPKLISKESILGNACQGRIGRTAHFPRYQRSAMCKNVGSLYIHILISSAQ